MLTVPVQVSHQQREDVGVQLYEAQKRLTAADAAAAAQQAALEQAAERRDAMGTALQDRTAATAKASAAAGGLRDKVRDNSGLFCLVIYARWSSEWRFSSGQCLTPIGSSSVPTWRHSSSSWFAITTGSQSALCLRSILSPLAPAQLLHCPWSAPPTTDTLASPVVALRGDPSDY